MRTSPPPLPPPKLVVAALDEEPKTIPGADLSPVGSHVTRQRTYAFVVDEHGLPIELGSGRFGKAYLGEERWLGSKTAFRRNVAIKVLQRNVSQEARMRFQMEKEILESVQGHPNVIEIIASGEEDNERFVPPSIRDRVENDFVILELLDRSLEEHLKGTRSQEYREDLLALPMAERVCRALDYMVPLASAIEYAHLIRDTCHRDIKPANVLLKLPDPRLRSGHVQVKLADFNIGKAGDPDMDMSVTRVQQVPGTLYFQSPEQETNSFELLVNTEKGSPEVTFFEDFYIDISENDTFSLFNRPEVYRIVAADRKRKKIQLARPFAESGEPGVRGRIIKSVGRPADIYSLGALFYYLVTGAYGNPKALHDSFRKFIEFEPEGEPPLISAYIAHEYQLIQSLRSPAQRAEEVAVEDRFFSYKHYLDANGELIHPEVMAIIAKAMIRNKADSYCMSWDLRTEGVSTLVDDLLQLSSRLGGHAAVRMSMLARPRRVAGRGALRGAWERVMRLLRPRGAQPSPG